MMKLIYLIWFLWLVGSVKGDLMRKYLYNNSRIKVMKKILIGLVFLLVLAYASALPVFPGAEGFGTDTVAGSGRHLSTPQTTIYKVTTLANSGSGSLRECVDATGPRICVFEVSGTIELTGDLNILNPYITIAGQTAPPPGIQIKGAGFRIHGAHDVLIQHLRIRPGDDPVGPDPDVRRAMSISVNGNNIPYNIVIDHCSLQWGIDANANIWAQNPHDITYSNNIISECLSDSLHSEGPHSMSLNVAHDEGGHRSVSIIKNLIAHGGGRNPSIGGNTHVELVNNVMYNCVSYYINVNDASKTGPHNLSIVGNVAIIGNDSLWGTDYTVTVKSTTADGTRIYVSDNMCNNYPDTCIRDDKGSGITWLSSPEVWSDTVTVIPTANNQARDWVLDNAGAWPAIRDSVDTRVTQEVVDLTGQIINCVEDGGSERCSKNGGGWPDYEENYRSLTLPSNPNGDDDGDGYTNLEEWIHTFSAQVEQASPDRCSDWTIYGQCSFTKPKYCDNGNLVDDCNTCGCPYGHDCQANGSCQLSSNFSSEMIALYHFNEGSGTIAFDSSVNRNDGTIYGATWTSDGVSGNALEFDGVDDYIDLGDKTIFEFGENDSFSWGAWAKGNDMYGTGSRYIISKKTWGSGFMIYYNGFSDIQCLIEGEDSNTEVVTNQNDNTGDDGTWHFYMCVRDATDPLDRRLLRYVDGSLEQNVIDNSNGAITGTDYHLAIGAQVDDEGNPVGGFYNGSIDEIYLYNSPLTQQEILNLYNGTQAYSEADLNEDGVVDIVDLIIVATNFGLKSGYDARADTDNNNIIDIFDIVFVASRFT
ncbi:hypothetical protein AYK26_01705 [Euryarchaeota archaeon SM23-78]|nr:MAG: hypothetical protein AYK26_01705 [Euryarchaeota archaeon SM23-78]